MDDQPIADADAHQRALEAVYREHVAGILTEPLGVAQLAGYFDVCQNTLRKSILPKIKGKRRVGARWQIPVWSMPVSFHVERGILPPG